MNTPSTLTLPSPALPAPRSGSRSQAFTGLTLTGVLLFVICLLVIASGFNSMRPRIMGLALHPYLVPLAIALPLVLMARLGEFPVRVLVALTVFTVMYCFSLLNGGSIPLGEAFKLASAVVTILVAALLVRRRGDFVAGALGLSLAVGILAWRGLQDDATHGLEVIEGANKNSYSLFALPAMLMAGFICIHMKSVPTWIKAIFVACTIPAVAVIFVSANRSGYLGCVVVGLLLFWDRRGKGMLLVGGIAAVITFWMMNYANTEAFDERMRQTVEGTASDEYRIGIIWTCAKLALNNPIIGVSPQELGFEIARNTQVGHEKQLGMLNAHNVFAHVAAASGLITFAAMLAIAATIWTLKPTGRPLGDKEDPARQARSLLRMQLILWAVRGMFTHEILYNPSCNLALGLCLGLFIVSQRAPADADSGKTKKGAAARAALAGGAPA